MENKINSIIEKEFDAKTIEIKRIQEGFSHFMFNVKIDKSPFELIVRFSNNKKETRGLSKEKWVIENMQKTGIPTPKIYAFHEDKDESYMIIEKLKGIRLDTIWDSLSKEEKSQITIEIGKIASKIHSIKLAKFGKLKTNGEVEGDDPFKFKDMGKKVEYSSLIRETIKMSLEDVARLSSYKHISKEFLAKYLSFMIKNKEIIESNSQSNLIHGDFHTGHLFVEKKDKNYEITGLIDFEFADSLFPEYDFIKLHRQGFFDDTELQKSLEKGYGTRINKKAVEFCRIMRDVGFAWAVLEAGNKDLSDKTLEAVEDRIDNF